MSNTHLCSKSVHERGVVREADAESGGGATGLAGEAGVGADDGEGRGIESTSRVGLLDGRVADGLRIELALNHDETGGGGDEEIGAEVARTRVLAHRLRRLPSVASLEAELLA